MNKNIREFMVRVLPLVFLMGLIISSTHLAFAAPHYALADDFVITIKTDNPGISTDLQFTIPTNPDPGLTYNYDVDCDNDGSNETTGETGDYTCTYGAAGTYTIYLSCLAS